MKGEGDICEGCTKGNGWFLHCVQIPGHYDGACGNCHKGGRGSRCTIREGRGDDEFDRDVEMERVEREVRGDRPYRQRYDRKYPQ
jgi:hypothetical protein